MGSFGFLSSTNLTLSAGRAVACFVPQVQLQAVADSRREQEQQYHKQIKQHWQQRQQDLQQQDPSVHNSSGCSSPYQTGAGGSFASTQNLPPPCSPAAASGAGGAGSSGGRTKVELSRPSIGKEGSTSATLSNAPSSKLSLQRSLSVSLPPDPSLSEEEELDTLNASDNCHGAVERVEYSVGGLLPPAVLAPAACAAAAGDSLAGSMNDAAAAGEASAGSDAAAAAAGEGGAVAALPGSDEVPTRLRVPRQKLKRASQVCNR